MTFTERGTIGDYFWLFQTHSCEIAFGCWCTSLMLYIASFSCRFLWTLSFGVLWMFFSNQLCKLPLIVWKNVLSTLLLLSHVSRVWLCTTPEMAAHQSPRPWDSPGKNVGGGCHFLLQCMKVKSESEVVQSCPTLCNPMECSPPGSSVHGIFQAKVLEWAFNLKAFMQNYESKELELMSQQWSQNGIIKSTQLTLKQKREIWFVAISFSR